MYNSKSYEYLQTYVWKNEGAGVVNHAPWNALNELYEP